ncbi:ATP-binding response regulator [Candidatus Venteria ishoeyi]|nr:hybrid sensor histidine kinase/response regulator [Candidatus Venteria ishoeyi]MDM8545581.1 hybrid sensor histidine kinase/response regulator [Candidatus Venteria ishoeyi]
MDTSEIEKGTLLIVDDVPNNLKMLFTYLRDHEFKIRVAQDGEDALEQLEYAKPDLILLDVMMPKVDGFEVCRRLKANPDTKDIPIIFMTALTDTVDKVQGFEIGAVDYITKPVQQEEVLARITTHLTLSKMKKLLQQEIDLREQDNHVLEQRNHDLEAYAKVVARDLKKPLIRLSGLTKVLLNDLRKEKKETLLQFVNEIEQSRYDMVATIDDLLLLAEVRTQGGTMDELNMSEIISPVQDRLEYLSRKYSAKIEIQKEWPRVWGYAPWLEKVWENLLTYSLKNGGRPPYLKLGAESTGNGYVRCWLNDNGPATSKEKAKHMFGAMESIEHAEEGLGMSIIQRIVEQYGGNAGVDSHGYIGNTYFFTLPEVVDYEEGQAG